MVSSNLYLGVNIDHVATLRQARHTTYPDPVLAMIAAEQGGADGITIHLREDRRHIQEYDVERIQSLLKTRMNLEMAVTDTMLAFAEKIKPKHCCFVPERREELTTEGGLDVLGSESRVLDATNAMKAIGVEVSLFIDPDHHQIEAAHRVGAPVIEIHTGAYADANTPEAARQEWQRIQTAARFASELGLIVNAGHGLHYENVQAIAAIPDMNELNIGHSIVAKALFIGMQAAVAEMKRLMHQARLEATTNLK